MRVGKKNLKCPCALRTFALSVKHACARACVCVVLVERETRLRVEHAESRTRCHAQGAEERQRKATQGKRIVTKRFEMTHNDAQRKCDTRSARAHNAAILTRRVKNCHKRRACPKALKNDTQ